jgi:hypothetical protein
VGGAVTGRWHGQRYAHVREGRGAEGIARMLAAREAATSDQEHAESPSADQRAGANRVKF